MTGKEFIENRINTGSRFLVSLHEDTREQIALLLEQYAALRQPAVIKSVCDHKWKEWEDANCNARWRCTRCKEVK